MEREKSIDAVMTGQLIFDQMARKQMTPELLRSAMAGKVTIQTIYNWLGGRARPSTENLLLLADVFGVQAEELVAMRRS